MVKDYPGEHWKNVVFTFEHINKFRLEVSNFGRLRTFNKISNGNILKGALINGYAIVRIRFFKARDPKVQPVIDGLRKQIALFSKELKNLADDDMDATLSAALTDLKKRLARKVKADDKNRKIYFQSLIHRLVANYFLKPPGADQVIVSHMDHNKINNRWYNLKWMTPDENYAHQKTSPQAILEKNDRSKRKESPTTKLSVTKVMLLKKLLNQNKPIRQLAKQFRVTDTQIIRIKKGINWADIEAAP